MVNRVSNFRKHHLNFLKKNKIYYNRGKVTFMRYHKFIYFNYTFIFYIPNFMKFYLCKFKHLNVFGVFMVSDVYFFKFFFSSKNINKIFIDPELSAITVLDMPYEPTLKVFHNFYLKTFYSFFRIFFFKIKFRGKGYYAFKGRRNTMTTRFGYSHRILFFFFNLKVVFLSKTSFIFFGLDFCDIKKAAYSFYFSKPFNIFTGRGVRFSKQKLFKKAGKVSTY